MKYYNEDKMKDTRIALEEEVLKWPRVSTKEMMGCLSYFYGSKFFAFLVTKGIVITKLSEEDRNSLSKRVKVEPFEMSGRTVKTWVRVTLTKPEDLKAIIPFVKKSYEMASNSGK